MNVTTEMIQDILTKNPELTSMGNAQPDRSRINSTETAILRAALSSEPSRAAIENLTTWIEANMAPQIQINLGHSSYGLKHIAEAAGAGYSANGEFIIAALLCGYRMSPHYITHHSTCRNRKLD